MVSPWPHLAEQRAAIVSSHSGTCMLRAFRRVIEYIFVLERGVIVFNDTEFGGAVRKPPQTPYYALCNSHGDSSSRAALGAVHVRNYCMIPSDRSQTSRARTSAKWIASGIGLALFGALCVPTAWIENALRQEKAAAAQQQSERMARQIDQQLAQNLSATYALAAMVREGKGAIRDFDAIATELIAVHPGISALQLAPGGVIRRSVPLSGNEKAIGHNLLADDNRDREARLALETGTLTLAGPFALMQGGTAIIGRLPVFLDEPKPHTFWGFTTALIRLPAFLDAAHLADLELEGYCYELWRIDPDSAERHVFATSTNQLKVTPVTSVIEVPNGYWTLGIAPRDGWISLPRLLAEAMVILLLSIVATRMALHKLHEQQQAEAALRLAAAAFDTQEAIVITDAGGTILRVNQAFIEITGYSADEVLGQSPRLLKSSRHGPDFYREMWDTLVHTGSWRGEIWDRRKNGEEYPKLLSITAVKDDRGVVTHYVGTHVDITEKKKADEKIVSLAFFDPLTGMHNRASLHDLLQQSLTQAERGARALALMLIDLDNFKTINDTLGHQAGDQLLVVIAGRLAQTIRHSDFGARFGGDEFVIVLPEIDAPIDAANVAEKIIAAVGEPCTIAGHELRCTPSIGICVYPDDAVNADELIAKADVAMYHAKSSGRGNYQFFRDEFQMAAIRRLAVEADLRKALAQRQFVLHYQPQLDLRAGRLCGVEGLLRWQHPERGLVLPAEFISMAEETGLIKAIGDWVLEEACRQMAQWRAHALNNITMSVNLAAVQFSDSQLPTRLSTIMTREGLPPACLHLELTESMMMANPGHAVAMMNGLVGQGLSLSIDDFGTGYSSLAYLKLFPISTLKIDRSFVKDIETDQNDAAICDMTVVLAHKLGLDTVAEGVETEAQLAYLHSIGCEEAQGYLIGKPVAASEVEGFIRARQPA